jgi:hypothetical protein
MKKLGMSDMPEVGDMMVLTARVECTRCSSNESQGSEPRKSVGFQITEMSLDEDGDDPADKLYKKGKK